MIPFILRYDSRFLLRRAWLYHSFLGLVKKLKLCSYKCEGTRAGAVWRTMAEGLPQLDSSPGAIRRSLPPPEGARAPSVQSRNASSMSPLRDFSPLHSSAPSHGSSDELQTTAPLELVGRLTTDCESTPYNHA